MICVSYTRVTSCIQGKAPCKLSTQTEEITTFCKNNKLKITKKYSDRKKDEYLEDAFLQMKIDGSNREFDMVITYSVYQFGKNISYAKDLLYQMFYKSGIQFAVVEDNFISSQKTEEEIINYFESKIEEYRIDCLKERTYQVQTDGLLNVHDEKYGYLLTDDHKGLVIDQEVVPIIKEIFQLVDDGLSLKKVADILNEKKYEAPYKHLKRVGKKNYKHMELLYNVWTHESVRAICKHTVYIGYWYKTVKGQKVIKFVEPIIDEVQFNRIQERFKNNTHSAEGCIRSYNAFVKHLEYGPTGKPLYCKVNKRTGIQEILFTCDYVNAFMTYEELEAKVIEYIKEEKQLTSILNKQIIDGSLKDELEMKLDYLDYCINPLVIESCDVLDQESELEKINERIKVIEASKEVIQQAYTIENKWVNYFRNVDIPESMTKEFVQKNIKLIVVDEDKNVQIYLADKYQKWKYLILDSVEEDAQNG